MIGIVSDVEVSIIDLMILIISCLKIAEKLIVNGSNKDGSVKDNALRDSRDNAHIV